MELWNNLIVNDIATITNIFLVIVVVLLIINQDKFKGSTEQKAIRDCYAKSTFVWCMFCTRCPKPRIYRMKRLPAKWRIVWFLCFQMFGSIENLNSISHTYDDGWSHFATQYVYLLFYILHNDLWRTTNGFRWFSCLNCLSIDRWLMSQTSGQTLLTLQSLTCYNPIYFQLVGIPIRANSNQTTSLVTSTKLSS